MKALSTVSLILALVSMLYMNVSQYVNLSISLAEAGKEACDLDPKSSRITTMYFTTNDVLEHKVTFINKSEIKREGRLYDVISMQKNGNVFSLKIFHDENEESILSAFEEGFWELFAPISKSSKHIVKFTSLFQDVITSNSMQYLFITMKFLIPSSFIQLPNTSPIAEVIKSPPRIG